MAILQFCASAVIMLLMQALVTAPWSSQGLGGGAMWMVGELWGTLWGEQLRIIGSLVLLAVARAVLGSSRTWSKQQVRSSGVKHRASKSGSTSQVLKCAGLSTLREVDDEGSCSSFSDADAGSERKAKVLQSSCVRTRWHSDASMISSG